ncbi:tRNA (N(6)-L-threonylcarbamoyladenosine(37)-C(2))-methylthiotransferase MtaB [Desulforudis sp. 1088]|uniref:tRNA (N(6)-L-threonylcarbamoyladenosine(37)-C(2))- methylthiotransferase MtaB n=2 Tax=Candidatus Desulforudis TaxID=471826 RepID=UPI003CE4FD8A
MLKTVAFATLGCKVNQYETQALSEQFERLGYAIVSFEEKADVYVINTCTVTHIGDRKSRQVIRRARRANPEALVVVTGCYAQVAPDEIAGIGDVDLIVGTRGRERLAEFVDRTLERGKTVKCIAGLDEAPAFEELPISRTQGRARAYIKVQEGCRDFCTYCIVPYARGPLRSRPSAAVIEEAERLVRNGYVELVLTGTHLGAYGLDLPDAPKLAELVTSLSRVPGLLRLRLSSIEPLDISPALVEAIASSPVACPHLHIPLQSGSNHILHRMGRRYSTREFALLVNHIRSKIPEVGITTDVMVGFPGESDAHFRESLDFVRRMDFSGLHVFKFSPRKGTPAAAYPDQVPAKVKESRSKAMLELGEFLKDRFACRYVGKTVSVLAEEHRDGVLEGYTGNYLRVRFRGSPDALGRLEQVSVKSVIDGVLLGDNL